ncbi:MAG: Fic family protein [Patescibacteria group bacterium]
MVFSLNNLNKRQEHILQFIDTKNQASALEILKSIGKKVAKITINRDLRQLANLGLIESQGQGRAVVYRLSSQYNLIKPIDAEQYFKIEEDGRHIKERFDFSIFSYLKNILTDEEKVFLQSKNQEYQKNIKNFSDVLLKKEFERLTIEMSWKSSRIEGNTYTLLETEQLLKEQQEPSGHTKEESLMILNHKKVLDYIRQNQSQFKTLSVAKIEDVHSLIIDKLKVTKNLRRRIVRITGTKYAPLDNQFQIQEAIERTCVLVNKENNPFAKAIILMLLLAYIQPFEDGNKRTSRLLGNAVLMAHNICPLSYRSIDELDYKKAIILFYEQNNLWLFKKLFIEQFKFAMENYFGG